MSMVSDFSRKFKEIVRRTSGIKIIYDSSDSIKGSPFPKHCLESNCPVISLTWKDLTCLPATTFARCRRSSFSVRNLIKPWYLTSQRQSSNHCQFKCSSSQGMALIYTGIQSILLLILDFRHKVKVHSKIMECAFC